MSPRALRILFLTKMLPLPANNGGRQRSMAILAQLLEAGHDVTLAALEEPANDAAGLRAMGLTLITAPWPNSPRDRLEGLARTGSVSAARFWSRSLARAVEAEARRRPVDLAILEYVHHRPYLRHLPAAHHALLTQNVESDVFATYARTARGPRAVVARVEAGAVRRLERSVVGTVDLVSTVSDLDAGRHPGAPRRPIVVCPNGWTASPRLAPSEEPCVSFVASLGWAPNAQAAVWFTSTVWPRVRARVPAARLLLVGRDPAPEVVALAGPDVEVTGTVPSVEPYLVRTRVAVAPLLAGSGSRLKILDALAAGRPVVATAVGAEGLDDLHGRGVVVTDGPGAMAEEIVRLLEDPAAAQAAGAAGREAVTEAYDWSRTLRPLLDWVGAGAPS